MVSKRGATLSSKQFVEIAHYTDVSGLKAIMILLMYILIY